jgi:hypothetical protein
MLIVNKLLENYNQELNKYVDLESHKINNYTNSDLPADVFVDPERLFFNNLTPYEWYDKAVQEGTASLEPETSKVLNTISGKIKEQINIINKLRFELDKVTAGVDLSNRDNVAKVYLQLEKAAKAFEDFNKLSVALENVILAYIKKNNLLKPEIKNLVELSNVARTILLKIRDKETENFTMYLEQFALKQKLLPTTLTTNSLNPGIAKYQTSIRRNSEAFSGSLKKFVSNDEVPSQYKLYGRYYYYHNIGLISKFNRYGTGLASEINNALIASNMDVPLVMEAPHIFQVIYPKKLDDSPILIAKDQSITQLPTALKERTVQSSALSIKADSSVIELLLYDHMIQDGDIVSINFNGDWILEKAELEKKPQTIQIKLNDTGRNYLILHAENIGLRPPNTMAISYKYRGIKREIILKSDYNKSELIEIVRQ